MNAAELRKSLDNGLRADTSGKTTPMQRLTPFLNDLVKYLEEREVNPLDMLKSSSDDATRLASASPNSVSVDASKATA